MIAILIFCLVVYLMGFIAAILVMMTAELELEIDEPVSLLTRLKDGSGSWINVIVWLTVLNLHHKGALNVKAFKR